MRSLNPAVPVAHRTLVDPTCTGVHWKAVTGATMTNKRHSKSRSVAEPVESVGIARCDREGYILSSREAQ